MKGISLLALQTIKGQEKEHYEQFEGNIFYNLVGSTNSLRNTTYQNDAK